MDLCPRHWAGARGLTPGHTGSLMKFARLELDRWHTISAGRHGNQGYLQLDQTLVKGRSSEGMMTLDVSPLVYLGGLPDMSHLLESEVRGTSVLTRYRGCIR